MGKDYYQTLELARDCQQADIAKAYRKLSLKYHPQLCKLDFNTSFHYFCQVSEAYEVLSDTVKRAFYDKYGEETLKEGFFQNGELQGGYQFNGNPDAIFEKFFGSNNAFSQIFDENCQEDYGTMLGHAFGNMNMKVSEQIKNKVVTVDCSLNELYNGCIKKVTYKKEVLNPDGRTTSEIEETRDIEIKKGSSVKNELKFYQLGNQSAGQQPSDLIFAIKELSHKDYQRKGNDLIFTKDITLLQALTAQSIDIITLDGRELLISLDQVVNPKTTKVVEGEGMPIFNTNNKGNLIIQFNIHFPEYVQPEAKAYLKQLLDV